MNRRSLRALARRLDYEDTPLAREGRAVVREMRAQADRIREGTQAMLWEVLHDEMPEGQGPPRSLRHGSLKEFQAWEDAHVPVEVRRQIGAILKTIARQMLADLKAEEEAERAARKAACDARPPTVRSGTAPSRKADDVSTSLPSAETLATSRAETLEDDQAPRGWEG